MRASLLAPFAAAAFGCTVTTYHVDVDDPAAVRVVPLPEHSALVKTESGDTELRYRGEVDGVTETRVTPIVNARGHLAPWVQGLGPYDIEFPIGQVAYPSCARWLPRHGCARGESFEIVAPLDHVRAIRRVSRYAPFLGGWLVFSGVIAGVGAAGALTSDVGDERWRIGGGTALAILSTAAVATGLYLVLAPPRTTQLFDPRAP